MRFDVLTLFPEIFQGYLTQSLLKLALDSRLVEIHLWNIREIYSNASGTLQYIELFCPASGQTFLNSQQITASTTFTLNHGISALPRLEVGACAADERET